MTGKSKASEAWEKIKSHLRESVPDFETYEGKFDQFFTVAETEFEKYRGVIEDVFSDLGTDGKTTVEEYKHKLEDWFSKLIGNYGKDE